MSIKSTAQRVNHEVISGPVAQRMRGAPTLYKPEYCQLVIERMLLGFSFGGFAGWLGVARNTIDGWRNKYPDFDGACARAQACRQWYWEEKAIDIAETGGKGGNQGSVVLAALYNAGR
jgi:hypothetical protein